MAWQSPTGYNDPDSKWSDETDAYDELTYTGADCQAPAYNWTAFLELTHAALLSNKLQIYARCDTYCTQWDIDVYDSVAEEWVDVYEGAINHYAWTEKTFATRTITKVRCKFYADYSAGNFSQVLREFDFWEVEVTAPTVTTQAVTDIQPTTATGNGNITDTGGENPHTRGICWNTGGTPTTADSKAEDDGAGSYGVGAFSKSMTGLSPATLYYVRAYAINSAGTSYGGQVSFTTNKDCTGSDSGSGADAKKTGEPKAAYSRSETGSGVDGHKAVAPQSAGETGSGVDALTALFGILARSDTGLGADAKLSLAVALIKADAGSGVEHILDRALVLLQAGTGVDVSHLVKTLLLSDSGSAVENSYLHILEGVKSSSDTGSGADSSALSALFQRDEAGAGAEQVIARAIFAKEYPTGAIDLAKVLTAAILGTGETGTGAEASLRAVFFKRDDTGTGTDAHKAISPLSEGDSGAGVDATKELSPKGHDTGSGEDAHKELAPISEGDTGAGADASSLEAMFSRDDVGSGAEAITLLAAMVASDTGVGVDAVLSFLRHLVDSGEGGEVVQLVGYIGRLMKVVTYLQAYSDLRVYTKPYSDLKVYTHEVKQ